MAKKINFLGGTTSSLVAEFNERLRYKNLVNFPGMIDTLYDQHAYGLINSDFEPVYLVEEQEILSNFPNLADDIYCLNFVAEAFKAFRKGYADRVTNTNVNFPPFLNEIIPVSGHTSFEKVYSDYLVYIGSQYSSFLQNDTRINDYNCYLTAMKEALKRNLAAFPVTRSGFLLSRYNDIKTSGLVLELANLDYDRDPEKGEIVQSRDFQCFVDFASAAGFYIDKNSPWRLYANLKSPFIREEIRKSAPLEEGESNRNHDAERILNSVYRLRSQEDDLYDLQDFIIKIYNDIKKRVPFYTKSVYNNIDNKTKSESVFRSDIDFLSAAEWLSMLLMVRLFELNRYTEARFQQLNESVIQNYKIYGTKQAIGKIGKICSEIIRENYEKRSEDTSTS